MLNRYNHVLSRMDDVAHLYYRPCWWSPLNNQNDNNKITREVDWNFVQDGSWWKHSPPRKASSFQQKGLPIADSIELFAFH